jgi:TolA-binding protein
VKNRHNVKTITLITVVIAAAAMLGSCAYFNTLYNARKTYGEAEKLRENKEGEVDRNLKEKYNEVITKCSNIIRDYPNSKWVDDAIFLMGQSLVRQGEYDKGIRKFIELTTNFPESGYVPLSIYWLATANYEKGEYNQALLYTKRFLDTYPKHKMRFEVMFLAGDISLALEDYEGALAYYSRVATESGNKKHKEEATLRSAELYYQMKDWTEAAASYESVLGKGMDWNIRYSVSLSLAQCYTHLGRCAEAKELCDGLLKEITTTKEKPAVMLGRAASLECMDSLQAALREYKVIASSFPRSNYSAEAYFNLGVIYHEKLDSLQQAQQAYAKVSNESASSEFAAIALQRSGSLKRLIELQEGSGENEGEEGRAEKRFLAAEIQLTRLNETDLALDNYKSVVDSFPLTSYAPLAAYAIGWIYRMEKKDTTRAVEAFTSLIRGYPISPQARGALYEVGLLGEEALSNQLEAYVDSAVADTARIAHEKDRIKAEASSMAASSLDSSLTSPAVTESVKAPADSIGAKADSIGAEQSPPGPTAADSIGTAKKTAVDTTFAPSREKIRRDTTYPTGGRADTSSVRKPVRPPEVKRGLSGSVSGPETSAGREDR